MYVIVEATVPVSTWVSPASMDATAGPAPLNATCVMSIPVRFFSSSAPR